MEKLLILHTKTISKEERKIITSVFGEEKITLKEDQYRMFSAGAVDLNIIIDFFNSPAFNALLNGAEAIEKIGLIVILINKLFTRNRKKIDDDNTRPRYTNVNLRFENKNIQVSNVNINNDIKIIMQSKNISENKEGDYSEEKLKQYISKK